MKSSEDTLRQEKQILQILTKILTATSTKRALEQVFGYAHPYNIILPHHHQMIISMSRNSRVSPQIPNHLTEGARD